MPNGTQWVVMSQLLNVRAQDNKGAEVLDQVREGDMLSEVSGMNGNWLNVSWQPEGARPVVGWVMIRKGGCKAREFVEEAGETAGAPAARSQPSLDTASTASAWTKKLDPRSNRECMRHLVASSPPSSGVLKAGVNGGGLHTPPRP